MRRIYLLLISIFIFGGELNYVFAQSTSQLWKAGIARVIITPEQNMWMAGYGGRDHPAEGKLHDLWAKALAIEDAEGNRGVLVTTDILGFSKGVSDRIRDRAEESYGISRSQIILNSSHTHTGPVLTDALYDIYPLDEGELKKIDQYSVILENKIVALVGEALKAMKPAKIYSDNGVVRFQVNRRNNTEALLSRQTSLNGPNDYAVPVIKVEDANGGILAVAFGYACHPTVLSFYNWSGDYPGFAQLELEKLHPGTTAMFFQGGGADMNPLPRRTVALATQYGRELAAAVDRVLNEEMKELSPRLITAYDEVDLSLSGLPDAKTLKKLTETTGGYQKRWASRMLDKLNRGESLIKSYPYPVQLWQIGDQKMVTLGGELVIDYTIRLKQIFGQDLFVMGYTNDVMSYIPSARILREGGYEGASSQIVYGLPGTWEADIETKIIQKAIELAEKAGVNIPESDLVEASR
ncbi:MAG: neutral/alkaline non-lysosomal ceramidase N-terminal domain-containing protein [Prolixibacteraceae bacterium]|nr:neutral/alkaline non-lysosomal ceramidase N-terminal domain-containing protein [Prolixibacteraceae bacterium]